MDELIVRVNGGGRACVPALSMTAYVLIEQEDWSEKEIAFVRRFLQPGMRALDVGANYGTYILAMAQAVRSDGRVWAYEPAHATARYLRKTINHNDLSNVELREAALSDREGTGRLRLGEHSETNRLGEDRDAGEEVALTTVYAEQSRHDWGNIDFVKIDAEGGELDIIRGGERFFAAQSPLVMFERMAVDVPNERALAAFRERGYELYKLIGPDRYLVPVDRNERYDAFDLNLFACKSDRAAVLAAAGLLATTRCATFEASGGIGLALWRRQGFAASFARASTALDPRYERALDAYAVWRDLDRPLVERCGALLAGAEILRTLAADSRNLALLSTCARVAHEAGMRVLAVDCLGRMLDRMKGEPPLLHEPFWPAARRYDTLRPAADRGNWFLAATFEAYEKCRAFSSQFVAPDALVGLEWLAASPYASPEMERRRQLTAIRAGRQRVRQPSPLLIKAGAGHLNPQLWGGRAETV